MHLRDKMNYYEQLGVNENATPAEIKRAYRAKAREKHPDKGGSQDEFAPIAKAYEVLSDPERRMLYDNTGVDRTLPVEAEAQALLLQLFNQALDQAPAGEVLDFVWAALDRGEEAVNKETERLTERKAKLLKRRDKISTSSERNLAHMVIDGELKGIDVQLANLEHQLVVHGACVTVMNEYKEEEEPVERHRGAYTFTVQSWSS